MIKRKKNEFNGNVILWNQEAERERENGQVKIYSNFQWKIIQNKREMKEKKCHKAHTRFKNVFL